MESQVYDSLELDFDDYIKNKSKLLPALVVDEAQKSTTEANRFRIVVCEHWLLGLCKSGTTCSFLHKYDLSKMPHCNHGKACKIRNCPKKHGDSDTTECIYYKQGFCFLGPQCNHRHAQLPPEACPEEASFELANNNSAMYVQQPNENYKVTLCTHWLTSQTCQFSKNCNYAHGEEDILDGQQQGSDMMRDEEMYDPTRWRLDAPMRLPVVPEEERLEYFLLQAPDLRSLRIAKQTERWRVTRKTCNELNASYHRASHVILMFMVRPMKGIYGIARLDGPVLPPVIGTDMSRDFHIQWMRTLRISMRSIAQMKVGLTGMLIGRARCDSMLDAKAGGLDLLRMVYRKPEWDWTKDYDKATKIGHVAQPVNQNNNNNNNNSKEYGSGNPSIAAATEALPPDVLFSKEWETFITAASQEVGYKGHKHREIAPPRNTFYKGNAPGFIFCDQVAVIEEMFQKKLFGMPRGYNWDLDPGAPVFILDEVSLTMYGIFQPVSAVTENIDPDAFVSVLGRDADGSCMRPFQVRVECAVSCAPLSANDYRHIFSSNHIGGALTLEQTIALCEIYAAREGLHHTQANIVRGGPQGGHGVVQPVIPQAAAGSFVPKFKFVEEVPVNIMAQLSVVRTKVLGTNAQNVLGIIRETCGEDHANIRLRGIGSKFIERPLQHELMRPMHFNVSASSEEYLAKIVTKLKDWIEVCRVDLEKNSPMNKNFGMNSNNMMSMPGMMPMNMGNMGMGMGMMPMNMGNMGNMGSMGGGNAPFF